MPSQTPFPADAAAENLAAEERAVPLTSMRPGERGRLHRTVPEGRDRQVLDALGLVLDSSIRLAKAGNPWIVQVRSTRIGLADAVAQHLRVIPEPTR